jgi:hypothetical protein
MANSYCPITKRKIMANNINVNGNVNQQYQSERLEQASGSSKDTQVQMAEIAAEGRMDALQAAQLAAQASRIEALGKNMKKGADAAKSLT